MVLTFLSLRLRPILVQGLFALAGPFCGIGFLSLSGHLLPQHLSRDVWRLIFFTWLSLHKGLHTQLSVDVLGPNLGCWLLDTDLFGAPLSLASSGNIGAIEVHISLIDWLIDGLIDHCSLRLFLSVSFSSWKQSPGQRPSSQLTLDLSSLFSPQYLLV